MDHTFLTISVPCSNRNRDAANRCLDGLGNPAKTEVRDALRGSAIHFVSMSMVQGGKKDSAFLVLEASIDGKEEQAIAQLCDRLGKFIVTVLEALDKSVPVDQLNSLLSRHVCRVGVGLFDVPGLNFSGTPGMTTHRIRQEYLLARRCREVIDDPPNHACALDWLRNVRSIIEQDEELAPLLIPEDTPILEAERTGPSIFWLITRGVWTLAWPIVLLLGIPVIVGTIAAANVFGFQWVAGVAFVSLQMAIVGLVTIAGYVYLRLRRMEDEDEPDDAIVDLARLEEITFRENRSEQNHLAGFSEMKAGWIRRMTLKLVFWVIAQFATRKFRPGHLGELGTIHFARWILLPKTNKLLFFSNYGGSWESYLEDFITLAHNGLTGVWSNTVGFPRTINLFNQGATDGDKFKRWARRDQQPTRFWYSAYPYLTTARIRHNAAIRLGLCSATTEDEAVEWLSHFGSLPPRPDTVETSEVQKILFGGLKPLEFGSCLLARLPVEVESARTWLENLSNEISFGGEATMGDCATVLALTRTGLERLGLAPEAIETFPLAFSQGMNHPTRANILGDTGDDKPESWDWGNERNSVDAAILLYHRTATGLDELLASNISRIAQYGGEVASEIRMMQVNSGGPAREPFGFVDGVSQPLIRGIARQQSPPDLLNTVEPGEFVLGYHDNRGLFPQTPTIPAAADPSNLLASIGPLEKSPEYSLAGSRSNIERDLGRNGTYLVIRQLEQDVDRFNSVITALAKTLLTNDHPAKPSGLDQGQLEHWIAAKMVGRWRDGTSLVNNPNRPGSGWSGTRKVIPDNSFRLGADDPLGQRCPLGAHIRRANPRDSFRPGSDLQIGITNRHRILRIGRGYESVEANPSVAGDESNARTTKGLLFMCLNSEIERQFEFVQQTWMMARLFHGLDGEVDSLVGRGKKGGRLTVPTSSGPVTITGIQDFVTARGGAYFFMPSRRTIRFLSKRI